MLAKLTPLNVPSEGKEFRTWIGSWCFIMTATTFWKKVSSFLSWWRQDKKGFENLRSDIRMIFFYGFDATSWKEEKIVLKDTNFHNW